MGDPLWSERIDSHFDDRNGFPPTGHPSEYAVAFEAAYPSARDRRTLVEDWSKRGNPSFGHRVLGALVASGRARCLFTTNFDDLVERAAMATDELVEPARRLPLTVGTLDQAERAERCMHEGSWPLLVKLHGDFRSERLMNTVDELRGQDERLRSVVARALGQFGLFVVGYSGRDDSVMDVLDEVVGVDGTFPAGLWWAVRPGTAVLPRVESLLAQAAAAGIEVGFVESENFDELAGQVERAVDFDDALQEHVLALRQKPLVTPVSLPVSPGTSYPLVRCSALELPEKARAVTLKKPLTSAEARKLIKKAEVWATVAASGRTVLAFGADDDIEGALATVGGRLSGTIALDPDANSAHRGLVYDALAKSLARRRPLSPVLRGRGHSLLVRPPGSHMHADAAARHQRLLQPLRDAYPSQIVGSVPKLGSHFAESVRIRIERHNGRWWLLFEPQTWVDLDDHEDSDRPTNPSDRVQPSRRQPSQAQMRAADWRRERWARRYNPHWNKIIDAWSHLIAPDRETAVTAHYFGGAGINAAFRISGRTGWSDRNASTA